MQLCFQKGKKSRQTKLMRAHMTGRRPERAKEESQKLDLKKWTQLCYSSRTPYFFSSWAESQDHLSAAKLLKRRSSNTIQVHPILFVSTLNWRKLLHSRDLGIWEFLQETFCCCLCYEKIIRYSVSEFLPSLMEAGSMVLKRIHGRLVL